MANMPFGKSRGSRFFHVVLVVWLALTACYSFNALLDVELLLFSLPSIVAALVAFWVAVSIWGVFRAVSRARRRAYPAALVAAVIPLVAVATVYFGRYLGDIIRFERDRAGY